MFAFGHVDMDFSARYGDVPHRPMGNNGPTVLDRGHADPGNKKIRVHPKTLKDLQLEAERTGFETEQAAAENLVQDGIEYLFKIVLDPMSTWFQEHYPGLVTNLSSREVATHLDEQDELASYQDAFYFPPECSVYLCGNSLGLQPKATSLAITHELEKWKKYGVEGHFEKDDNSDEVQSLPWVQIDELCIDHLQPLLGAKASEIAVMNTLTVNLHLMMVSFYRPTSTRYKILIEAHAFPSDQYAVMSQLRYHGYDEQALIQLAPKNNMTYLETSDILQVIQDQGHEIALILFSGVQYYTGQFFNLEAITEAGHAQGCTVGFDLAHAVGNVPLSLHDWGPDFAVFCTYKYLNSGPGGIGGCFVHERHSASTLPRFAGWWGHQKQDRFEMKFDFTPAPGAFGFQLSNPSVLLQATLKASLEVFHAAGLVKLREKSVRLTAYLEALLEHEVQFHSSLSILTPRDVSQRGAQLSLLFSNNIEHVHATLTQRGIICDLRSPNVMRIAPCPLYNSFQHVYDFVQILKQALVH